MSFFKKTFIISLIALGVLGPVLVLAVDPYGLSTAADQAGLADLAISKKSIPQFAGEVIGVGLSLIGIVFFLLMLYAGLRWMIAMGKSEDVQKAKDTLEAAAIGLVIVLAAYAITQFVFTNLGVGGGGGGSTSVDDGVGPPAPSGGGTPATGYCLWNCTTAPDCEYIAGDLATEETVLATKNARGCNMEIGVEDCTEEQCPNGLDVPAPQVDCFSCCQRECDINTAGLDVTDNTKCKIECQRCNGDPKYNASTECVSQCIAERRNGTAEQAVDCFGTSVWCYENARCSVFDERSCVNHGGSQAYNSHFECEDQGNR